VTAEHAAAAGGEALAKASALVDDDIAYWLSNPFMSPDLLADKVCWWVERATHTHNATAADTVLAAARRLCCGEHPAPHHAATDAHSQRMAFAEELARAVRGS
jgi:hypothetical protein